MKLPSPPTSTNDVRLTDCGSATYVLLQELEEIHIDTSNVLNGAMESHSLLLVTKVSQPLTQHCGHKKRVIFPGDICIPSIGFFIVEIRGPGQYRGGAHTLHDCVRWSPSGRIRAWRAWRLGDGQTEAEGVPSQRERGDALLRRMLPYLTRLGEGDWQFSRL